MAWSDQITKGRWLRLGFRYPHPAKPFQGEMSDNEKLSEIVLAIANGSGSGYLCFQCYARVDARYSKISKNSDVRRRLPIVRR
jgi:hypothetical protein